MWPDPGDKCAKFNKFVSFSAKFLLTGGSSKLIWHEIEAMGQRDPAAYS